MSQKPYWIHDRFFSHASQLRRVYDRRFADPLKGKSDRFVWDYWHVPSEYTLLRTPAHAFFPQALYARFHRHLVQWGRMHLGCHDVSPPWLSCYVEGCRQELHSDVPHGPLAFVFSLTNWRTRKFRGGQTFLFKNHKHEIAPQFNRLLLFNPSIPHGVNQVHGTHDLRYGRLVIHGWFVNPRPFWVGPLTVADVREGVEHGLAQAFRRDLGLGRGMLALRLNISPTGKVVGVKKLVSTLRDGEPRSESRLIQEVSQFRFARKGRASRLTLPLSID